MSLQSFFVALKWKIEYVSPSSSVPQAYCLVSMRFHWYNLLHAMIDAPFPEDRKDFESNAANAFVSLTFNSSLRELAVNSRCSSRRG